MKMPKYLLTTALMLQGISVAAQHLRPGDLLFHVPAVANQITDVTPAMIDHVAIVLTKDSVIEAKHRGVVTTPTDSLRRQDGYYIIGSFHDRTGRITDYWTQFYAQRGMTVPEGQPGTNPAELSKRKAVRIVGRLH